ncbi:MAG: sulfotransferase domain-containing protein [Deltaproteobacteria bacterium]|nr:sulfotransferase domain-containing protein [Deltaproteobacteria bacterium]MBW2153070.1 sulfotransferase domain-containing protein [Deltaproteobacteria bacterium]
MNDHLQHWGGLMHYDINNLAPVFKVLTGLHHLAQQIAKQHTPPKPINTYIYGASVMGRLTAMVFENYDCFKIRGFLDRNAYYMRFVSYELSVFFSSSYPVFHPENEPPSDIDIILCVTAPDHYPEIKEIIGKRLPSVPVYFFYDSPHNPPLVPLDNRPRTPLLVATAERCGTHWFEWILRFLLLPYGCMEVDAAIRIGIKRIINNFIFYDLTNGQYTVDHFQLTDELISFILDSRVTSIFLYRDPRDIQVSYSFYKRSTFHPNPSFVAKKAREILKWLKLPRVLKIRYEDLRLDPRKAILRLANFLNLFLDDETITNIIQATSFEYFS